MLIILKRAEGDTEVGRFISGYVPSPRDTIHLNGAVYTVQSPKDWRVADAAPEDGDYPQAVDYVVIHVE